MNTTRNTPCGPITGCGCQWPGVAAYKGIRYVQEHGSGEVKSLQELHSEIRDK